MNPTDLPRRDFLKRLGLGSALLANSSMLFADEQIGVREVGQNKTSAETPWPVLRRYDRHHQLRIAMQ